MRSQTSRRFPGLMPGVILAIICIAAFDFVGFVQRAARAVPDSGVSADAVVALTGGSGLRIAAGIALIDEGKGQRLLVSGVHPSVELAELQSVAGGAADVWACCVDIGYLAESTLGNAEETSAWAAANEYDSLIVVTSDYHMPRSLRVLTNAMPETRLEPWPVRTVIDPKRVWTDAKSFRGLFIEWLKWRVTTLG